MEGFDINDLDIDVAFSSMAFMIGKKSNEILAEPEKEKREVLKEELQALFAEQKLMYSGDKRIIEKIFKVYCPIIKKEVLEWKRNIEGNKNDKD